MRILLAVALTACVTMPLSEAFAQSQAQTSRAGPDQAPSASETLNPSLANGAPPIPAQSPNDQRAAAATGDRANANASLPVIPSDWGGDAKSWANHVKACKARYKGYDAGTDQYPMKGGGMTRCMLAMGKAK